jgi:hypothetical protein
MSAVFKYEQELEATSCCVCGIQFGVPPYFIANARKNAGSLYCPNGHCLGWSKTEADKLREQLEKASAATEWQRARANQLEKSLIAQKGQVTKLKKRVANGVCPCCRRSFAALAQHMRRKHPDYVKEQSNATDDND